MPPGAPRETRQEDEGFLGTCFLFCVPARNPDGPTSLRPSMKRHVDVEGRGGRERVKCTKSLAAAVMVKQGVAYSR